jgi:hypothetical protein
MKLVMRATGFFFEPGYDCCFFVLFVARCQLMKNAIQKRDLITDMKYNWPFVQPFHLFQEVVFPKFRPNAIFHASHPVLNPK